MKLLDLILNTPEKYWLIIEGIHFHKGSIGLAFILIGLSLILLKCVSHLYIGRPELCLSFKAMFWERVK
jgi:hypothetical protein